MKIITGTVMDGRIVVEGERLTEGERVTVLKRDGDETFQVSPEEKRRLQANRNATLDLSRHSLEINHIFSVAKDNAGHTDKCNGCSNKPYTCRLEMPSRVT